MKPSLFINRVIILLIINSIISPFLQFYFVFFHNRFLFLLFSYGFLLINLLLIPGLILNIFLKRSLIEKIAISCILFFSILNIIFFADFKLEGGHDPGVYFQNSVQIFKEVSFKIINSNFLTYPGYLLNSDNRNIVTQFPPGFSLYLSLFHTLSNNYILNVTIAVSFLLLFSSILFFYSLKNLTQSNVASLVGLVLFLINYYTITFYRATYIETYLTFIVLAMVYISTKISFNKKYLLVSLLIAINFIYIRSESLINVVILLFLISYFYFKYFKNNKGRHLDYIDYFILFFCSYSLICIFSYCFFIFNYFSNVIDPIKNIFLNVKPNKDVSATINSLKYNPVLFHALYFLQSILPFSFLPIIILVFGKIKSLSRETKNSFLFLFLFFLPQLIYIIYPGIAFYLPWYFRRIYPYFIPFSIILFTVVVSKMKKNIQNTTILILIILINILLSINIISYKETGLSIVNEKINNFTKNNKVDKIIFIDRLNLERYASTIGIIHSISTIYDRIPFSSLEFYNCFLSKNQTTYIITSIVDQNIFKFNLNLKSINLVDQFTVQEFSIDNSCDLRSHIMKPYLFTTYNKLFNPCKYPPDKRNEKLNNVYIYKISINTNNKTCSQDKIYKMSKEEIIKEYNSYL